MEPSELAALFRHVASRLDEARDRLAELDGVIGDADHGRSMAQGFAAVARETRDAAAAGASVPALLSAASRSFLDAVGATTGPLYASAFAAAAERTLREPQPGDAVLVAILVAMADGIARRGKAGPGDKTMMDAFGPAARAAMQETAAGGDVGAALRAAAKAADEGCEATRAMIASKGRAARLGARSLGHVDPGAASAAIIVAAVSEGYEAITANRERVS